MMMMMIMMMIIIIIIEFIAHVSLFPLLVGNFVIVILKLNWLYFLTRTPTHEITILDECTNTG